MKKMIARLLTPAFITVLAFATTACSASDIPDSSALDTVVSVSEGGKATVEAFEPASLEELLATPFMQSHIKELSINADVEVYVEDENICVFRYTFKEMVDITPEDAGSAADDYQNARDIVADKLNDDDLIFRIIYINADGTELYSADFD